MIVKLKIKEIREGLMISLEELSKETGIEKERLEKVEDNVDEILFIEMLIIAKSLGKNITDLYVANDVKIQ